MATLDPGGGWEQLFWTVFERTGNPVALLDEDRRFVDLNEPALTVLDRSRGDLLAHSLLEVIKPDEHDIATREWETFLRAGEFSGQRTFIRGNGNEVPLEFAGRLATINGARRAVYVVVADSWKQLRPTTSKSREQLTAREREVVRLVAMGLDTNEIAARLYLSPETVRTHVRNAMRRLHARTRAQLVCIALTSDPSLQLLHMEE